MRWMSRIGAADMVTVANGFLGTLAITYVLDGEHVAASLLIFLAVAADGLDGRIARRFGSPHRFGHFLDSISDAVSFVLAPGLIIYNNFYSKDMGSAWVSFPNAAATAGTMFFVVFGLLRLARFAGKDHRMNSFLGLPTPAAAMVIISLCLVLGPPELNPFGLANIPHIVLGIVVGLAFLMVTDIQYPKIKGILAGLTALGLMVGILPLVLHLAGVGFPVGETVALFLTMALAYVLMGPLMEASRKRDKA